MSVKKRILISACLLGINCRYDQSSQENQAVLKMVDNYQLIPVCPEQLGGLSTPRPISFFTNGDGSDTINGKNNLINEKGENVSRQFLNGAKAVLKICKTLKIKEAILKENSPSCGKNRIYLYETLTKGSGVTKSLLIKNGMKVMSEKEI